MKVYFLEGDAWTDKGHDGAPPAFLPSRQLGKPVVYENHLFLTFKASDDQRVYPRVVYMNLATGVWQWSAPAFARPGKVKLGECQGDLLDKSCCGHGGYKCGLGEGDCDRNSDCAEGLRCGEDNCPQGGHFERNDDCCETPKGGKIITTNYEMQSFGKVLSG